MDGEAHTQTEQVMRVVGDKVGSLGSPKRDNRGVGSHLKVPSGPSFREESGTSPTGRDRGRPSPEGRPGRNS